MTTQATTQHRSGRLRQTVGITAVIAVVVVGVMAWRSVAADEVPPYTDARSTGLVTLCDAQGKAVTEGKVGQQVATVALGSTAAPAGFDGPGAVGTIFAHQPREGVDPSEFSGTPLTGSALFTDSRRPAARVTPESTTLADFVAGYPALYDGYVQLRLIVSAPGVGAATDSYDTADLKIDGDSWKVVRGGNADCTGAGAASTAHDPNP